MSRTIRVDREVADALYRRRLPHERNHNGAISRALTEETTMNLMICVDGVEHATVPLLDGNDSFNNASERGALDRAYEAKQSNPDSVVTIVIDTTPDEPEGDLDDREFVAESLSLLADLDEGEYTDGDRLVRLAKALRAGQLVLAPAAQDAPIEA